MQLSSGLKKNLQGFTENISENPKRWGTPLQ